MSLFNERPRIVFFLTTNFAIFLHFCHVQGPSVFWLLNSLFGFWFSDHSSLENSSASSLADHERWRCRWFFLEHGYRRFRCRWHLFLHFLEHFHEATVVCKCVWLRGYHWLLYRNFWNFVNVIRTKRGGAMMSTILAISVPIATLVATSAAPSLART